MSKLNNLLEYRGYSTKIEFDSDSNLLNGKIEGINDLIYFESDNSNDIVKEFHQAVDDYLEFCKENKVEPDKEYSGTFNVRIDKDLHKKLALEAYKSNESLNATVEASIKQYIDIKTRGLTQIIKASIYRSFTSIEDSTFNTRWDVFQTEENAVATQIEWEN